MVKQKKCRICKTKFTPTRALQPTCEEYECKLAYAVEHANKAIERKKKSETKLLKEKVKTLSDYAQETQSVFNQYISLRDEGKGCISCLTTKPNIQYHAGHYRSVGAAPHLRFHELNVNLQCSSCNNHKSGNSIEYRINLIKRIGIDAVEWLESQNKAAKYSKEDLIELKAGYKQKIKELS
jgi:hypothetical protein